MARLKMKKMNMKYWKELTNESYAVLSIDDLKCMIKQIENKTKIIKGYSTKAFNARICITPDDNLQIAFDMI